MPTRILSASIRLGNSFSEDDRENDKSPRESCGLFRLMVTARTVASTYKKTSGKRPDVFQKGPVGVEPTRDGFAIRCLSHLATAPKAGGL